MEQRDNQQPDAAQVRDEDRQRQEQESGVSTSAQRSGGQSQDGKGMGNESFEGSSLGGPTTESLTRQRQGGGNFGGQGQGKSSETMIDPTTGHTGHAYAREGQGAERQASQANRTEQSEQRGNPLDSE